MISMQTLEYFAHNRKLIYLQGPLSSVIGLQVGPVLQSYILVPKSFSRVEFQRVAVLTAASTCVIIMLQAIVYIICIALFIYVSEKSKGFSSVILTLIPFLLLKFVFNLVAQKVCLWTHSMPFRIIFINNNAILQRMMLCWAIATQFHLGSIIFIYSVDLLSILIFSFFVIGPLYVHLSGQSQVILLVYWLVGKSVEKKLTKKQKAFAISERAKWVYFTVLNGFGEAIVPFWQIIFYYLTYSTMTRKAFNGFEKEANGFPLIIPHTIIQVAGLLAAGDVLNLVIFSFIVRKNFRHFDPFRFLNVVIKKFDVVLALSVLSIVLAIQCMMLIDCRIDISPKVFLGS